MSVTRLPPGERPHRILLQNPGPAVPDGDGGYVQTWTDLAPPWVDSHIADATTDALERLAAGTVRATATHIVSMPFHPQVTTQTRILFGGRAYSVVGAFNPELANVQTIAICVVAVP